MITVTTLHIEAGYQEVIIDGHAQAAEAGEDLVCAGVSSIAVGILNALDQKVNQDDWDALMEKGHIEIQVHNLNNPELQLILDVMMIQLKTMEEQYSQYIEIRNRRCKP